MAKTKIVLNGAGFKALLTSPEVQADLDRRAAAIAAAAGPGNAVQSRPSGNRGRATVYTESVEAKRAEAEDRALTRAIDAGRT